MTNSALDAAYRGFREDFLNYEVLTKQLRAWAESFPELARLQSLGATPEGREMWLLTIGSDPDRKRPALWIDANMHASELCGTNVALAIAEDALRVQLGLVPHSLPAHLGETLKDLLFYVMPRISPDGAEQVLDTGRYIRSIPRDSRPNQQHSFWKCEDVDGDGLALVMRVEDPSGEFVASSEVEGLMLPRRLEDPGPYYKIYPEGRIQNFDGHRIPAPYFLSDNEVDLNRNFPYTWAPENKQSGAGAYPTSEPESRAVVDFASAHPNIFAWLNLHTFGGVFIRPLGDKPDSKMDPFDLAIFRQIGAWAEELTGYPMVSGFEEFTYEPETPIYGDLSEYAYHQRGCIGYVVELWDLFEQIGAKPQKRFVDRYSHLDREELIALGRWDAEHNKGRVLRPWKAVEHAQLGAVEVGGIDPRFGMWNPPKERLAELCAQHSSCFLRVAAMAPKIQLEVDSIEELAGDLHCLNLRVRNTGYLPTHILGSAKELDISEELALSVVGGDVALADTSQSHQVLGHLDGWGRGLYDGDSALFFARSRGNSSELSLRMILRGSGAIKLRVGSCRVGWIERCVEIP